MKYGKKLLLPLLTAGFIAAFFYLSFLKANAQQNFDVTVTPVFFDLTANPSDTLSEKIRIRNNTTSPIPIKIEVQKLSGDVNGDLTLSPTSSDDSLSWIKFDKTSFVATPLEWSEIPFAIDIPSSAAYGYYFAITFKQDDASPFAKTGAKITGAAAVPILLNVKKEGAKFQGKFLSFKSDASWYEYPPVNLLATFENTGNVHIRPHGNIFIRDWLGRQVAVLPLNSKLSTILPDTKKSFENSWNDSFIVRVPKMQDGQVVYDKNGNAKTELKIRFDKILDLRVGKYTATAIAVISTDSRDIAFQSETSFFVFPWKVILGGVLFVIFAFIGFFGTIKNFAKRVIKIFKRNKESI